MCGKKAPAKLISPVTLSGGFASTEEEKGEGWRRRGVKISPPSPTPRSERDTEETLLYIQMRAAREGRREDGEDWGQNGAARSRRRDGGAFEKSTHSPLLPPLLSGLFTKMHHHVQT